MGSLSKDGAEGFPPWCDGEILYARKCRPVFRIRFLLTRTHNPDRFVEMTLFFVILAIKLDLKTSKDVSTQ